MLTITTSAGVQSINCDDYYVKQLASGYDEIVFTISIYDPLYPLIQEEASIVENSDLTTKNTYLVKAIDAGNSTATIKAQIDLDEWKSTMTINYSSASSSIAGILTAVKPTGWAVIDQSGLSYSRTIHLDSATPLAVLEQCRSTFSGVTFRFDNSLRTVTIINMNTVTSIGAFATKELNLKENNYKGKSTGLITRLYAYGKNDLSFASINGGKAYVDCNTYTDRIICGYWKDQRYTVAANLLSAAQERVNQLGVPQRSYDCNVVDLAAVDPSKYGYLDFTLFTTMTLIDDTRASAGVKHQVVERWIYPNLPHKNKVVLSTVAPRIQNQVAQILDSYSNPNSELAQQQQTTLQTAIDRATEQITGATGGYMRNIYDSSGNWVEQVIMNTQDILTATKVWRWNMGGLGYSSTGYNGTFGTAITQNGEIVANYITTGTLDASLITVTNLDAGSITTGSLSASRISGGTLDASQITVTNLDAGSITTGSFSANRISGGTLDASTITVTNLNANSITAGYISASVIQDRSLDGDKIKLGGITGGVSNGQAIGELGLATISGGNIGTNTISGGSYGNLGLSTITTSNTIAGINTSLGYADFSNSVFNNATRCSYMYCNYLDVGTTGRINAFSATSLSVYYGGSYYSATFQQPSVSLTHSSAFQVEDTNGNTQWVSNVTAASLGSYVLAH